MVFLWFCLFFLYISVRMFCLALLCEVIGQNSFIYQTIKATHIQKDVPHHLHWVPICSSTKEFHKSPEWSRTKIYLFGNNFTVRVAIHRPLHVLETGPKSNREEGSEHFLSALIAHETTPKVGQYLKSYSLKELPQGGVTEHPINGKSMYTTQHNATFPSCWRLEWGQGTQKYWGWSMAELLGVPHPDLESLCKELYCRDIPAHWGACSPRANVYV